MLSCILFSVRLKGIPLFFKILLFIIILTIHMLLVILLWKSIFTDQKDTFLFILKLQHNFPKLKFFLDFLWNYLNSIGIILIISNFISLLFYFFKPALKYKYMMYFNLFLQLSIGIILHKLLYIILLIILILCYSSNENSSYSSISENFNQENQDKIRKNSYAKKMINSTKKLQKTDKEILFSTLPNDHN